MTGCSTSQNEAVPLLTAADLRQPARMPDVPFRVSLADGASVTVTRLLRVLPGKRVVGEAMWRDRPVLAKLFVGHGSDKYWQREVQGVAALQTVGIPTPVLLFSGQLQGGGHVLLTGFLAGSRTLAERWSLVADLPAGHPEAVDVLRPAFSRLGEMHAARLVQTDLHLGNFLDHQGVLYVIDGDGVRKTGNQKDCLANLALLIAQLPVAWDAHQAELVAAYGARQTVLRPAAGALYAAVETARAKRLRHFLGKTLRECSQFAVSRDGGDFVSVVRADRERLAAVLQSPDQAISTGKMLKDGGTCTVARVDGAGGALVIKRYNLKNFRHALSRCWRPSRAWHAWLAGHRLAFYGIATPTPLALKEERVGPLRRRAFLITEFCPGRSLLEHLESARVPPPVEASAIVALFQTLHRLRISHGDFKATNLLWHAGAVVVIDLDAMIQHTSDGTFRRAWRRDRTRFLQNWPADSVLHRWLDRHLP
ncbi:lipopolysaccharide kinase InaA family protein [Propionivibrio limicola]|uniref:lipopolysaccharide kinase InaA family protein n=1 Tax=Propionivibrio limicola TaxID=167645 RepID=UPI0012913DBA|nr:lipopolysaccharide kinase InaA family protein [Propionivibrio limicola]